MYKPLSSCTKSLISIEVAPKSENGLIFYNGPLIAPLQGQLTDFIALDLLNGYPRLTVNLGSGLATVTLDGKDGNGIGRVPKLNDGKWHKITISKTDQEFTLTVDDCQAVAPLCTEASCDRKPCSASMRTPGLDKLLMTNDMLQMGGRKAQSNPFPDLLKNVGGFNGCIKNFRTDSGLYNLGTGDTTLKSSSGISAGCPDENAACLDGGKPICGANGICTGSVTGQKTFSCVCKNGYRGTKCSTATTVRNFKQESYNQWKQTLPNSIVNGMKTQLKALFRTRQLTGVLLYIPGTKSNEYMLLQLRNSRLEFIYSLEDDNPVTLSLPNLIVSDGQWHSVTVNRIYKWSNMIVDSGNGPMYGHTDGTQSTKLEIVPNKIMYGGARMINNIIPARDDYKQSCLNDLRINDVYLPMLASEDSANVKLEHTQNVQDNCVYNSCVQPLPCRAPFVCVNLWQKYECNCKTGFTKKIVNSVDTCRPIDYCLPAPGPCFFGRCTSVSTGFLCTCENQWKGPNCNEKAEAVVAAFSLGGALAIIICVIVLLLLILIAFIIYCRRRGDDKAQLLHVDPEDDIRDNVVHYDEEGGGEEDHDGFDISKLQKPVDPIHPNNVIHPDDIPRENSKPNQSSNPFAPHYPYHPSDIGPHIDDRKRDADNDPNAPPYDGIHEHNDEGEGSSAGTLSSLNSGTTDGDQDFDFLHNMGPKFGKLADMYGH